VAPFALGDVVDPDHDQDPDDESDHSSYDPTCGGSNHETGLLLVEANTCVNQVAAARIFGRALSGGIVG
jgi:hypothetical protein